MAVKSLKSNVKNKKPAMGRGLSVLLAQAESTYANTQAEGLRRLTLDQLMPGKFQPRRQFDSDAIDQLAQSIKARGVLQPLLVRKLAGSPHYEIIAGERRWRAAQRAGVHDVPVVVQEITDAQALEIGLIENLQRQDLNGLEEATAYRRLMDEFGHSQQALSETIGKSRSHVANTLRLLNLPDVVQSMIARGELTAGHARALLGAADPVALAKQVIAQGLSVRATEALAARVATGGSDKPAKSEGKRTADIIAIEADLAERLGLKVELVSEGAKGRLTLHFRSLDQFDDLLTKLTRPV